MMISQQEVEKLPTTKHEDYKYTNIQRLFERPMALTQAIELGSIDHDIIPHANHLVLVNGQLKVQQLTGIKVGQLSAKSANELEKLIPKLSDPLFKFNQTHALAGVLVEVDTTEPQLIYLQHLFYNLKDNVVADHIVIWIKKGQHQILEVQKSFECQELVQSQLVSIVVEAGAHCHHTRVNCLASAQHSLATCTVSVDQDANYQHVLVNAGGGVSRYNYQLCLEKPGAEVGVYGLYATKEKEHVDAHVFVHHKAPHTNSNQIFKATLDDESRGVFTGLVRVEQQAQQINAKQLNKNLLLSPKARANSRPQLEIFADDVKCSHGSTTGQLSQNELFYFASRGIRPERARRLLIQAMGEEILLKITNPQIKDKVRKMIEDHLAK